MYFKQIARVLSLALVVLLAAAGFSACGETTPAADGGGAAVDDAGGLITGEPDDENDGPQIFTPNLPEIDWGGRTITFLVRGPEYVEWESQDIYAEAETGAPVNDAVFRRNAILEERHNFYIRQVGTSGLQGRAERSVRSGSNDYDVFMVNTHETNNLALRGNLTSLNALPHFDLSAEWWDQNSIYGFTVEGNTLFMTGDLSIMPHDATWIMIFNKQLAQDFQVECLYTMVRENRWTVDAMHNIMRNVATDLDGDGLMRADDDLFGLVTHDSTFDGLFFGMGMRVSSMDANGRPYLVMNNERIINVMQRTIDIMDSDITLNTDPPTIQRVFEENRAFFLGEVLQLVIRLRAMETPFGVLPFPKLDSAQEDFAHMIHPTAAMVSVPISLGDDDKEFAAFVLEALAAESRNLLIPAYYTITLEGQQLRDEESADMLDIILRTRSYDLGYIANWGNLFSGYVTSVRRGDTDFASVWERSAEAALARMERDIEAYLGGGLD